MDFTKIVAGHIKPVVPRSSIRGFKDDFHDVDADVVVLSGETHVGTKPVNSYPFSCEVNIKQLFRARCVLRRIYRARGLQARWCTHSSRHRTHSTLPRFCPPACGYAPKAACGCQLTCDAETVSTFVAHTHSSRAGTDTVDSMLTKKNSCKVRLGDGKGS
jgi:hypothetical protein